MGEKKKANYSMIAYDMGVNFEVVNAVQVYDNYWIQKESNGEVTREGWPHVWAEL